MLLPLPDAAERYPTRPWATYVLLALLVLAFLPTYVSDHANLRDGTRRLERALEYHADHPYLKLDLRLQQLLAAEGGALTRHPVSAPGGTTRGGKKQTFKALEQVELDGPTRSGFDGLERLSYWRWGLVPITVTLKGLCGHLFLHAGGLPLLGNLILLFLVGSYLEGRWGWWAVPVGFAASGLAAAVVFVVLNPKFPFPLVGGAAGVAGLVGAFVVTFGFRKVSARYWLGSGRDGTVAFPALLLLAVWGLREALSLVSPEVLTPAGLARAVVVPHHVAGFCVGFVLGGALRFPAARRRAVRLTGTAARAVWSTIPRPQRISRPSTDAGVTGEFREDRRRELPAASTTGRERAALVRPSEQYPPRRRAGPKTRSAPPPQPDRVTLEPPSGTANGLRVTPAVLLGVKEGQLVVEVDGGAHRTVPLARVRGIAAAAVYEGDLKPAYILDLVLDLPGGGGAPERVLRCHSDRFDPRKLVPSEPELEDALLSLAVRLRIETGAAWLLGAKRSELGSFASPAEHEQALLAVLQRDAAAP